jgi:DNA polymerase III delta prime subunit
MDRLHHANIVVSQGDITFYISSLVDKVLNFSVQKNPDFLFIDSESFGIEDVRDFERWAIGKPLVGEVKVALLITKSLTFEAQNALLKIFEEPKPGTYIFLGLNNLGNILPTLLSRVQMLNFAVTSPETEKSQIKDSASKFLHANIKDRFGLIRSLVKGDKKSEMKSLIQSLERIASAENADYTAKKDILTAKIFASARGGSAKMLLEWLSCVL